jgi:hypothetical protein
MSVLLQVLIGAILQGALYTLGAVGLSLSFGVGAADASGSCNSARETRSNTSATAGQAAPRSRAPRRHDSDRPDRAAVRSQAGPGLQHCFALVVSQSGSEPGSISARTIIARRDEATFGGRFSLRPPPSSL